MTSIRDYTHLLARLCLATALVVVNACEPRDETPASYVPPAVSAENSRRVFEEPLEPALFELASGSLAVWRDYAPLKPVLVIFSKHPLLSPVSAEKMKNLHALLASAQPEEIERRGRFEVADPAFLPPQTVSIALAENYFSEIIYVYPTSKKRDEFSSVGFPQRAVQAGFLSLEEAQALTATDGVLTGTVRGVPFRCVHPEALPRLQKPALVHVDLGYFQDLYINEIKTPVYDLLYQTASSLRDAGYRTLGFTLSFSNQEVGFSLESRFLIRDFAQLLRQPELLDGQVPASWALRSAALYASAMFSEERARELYQQASTATPDDSAAHFSLAMALFQAEIPELGFTFLDRAVSLDPGYAPAYVELAEQGFRIGQTDQALALIEKAAKAMPGKPFVELQQADLLIRTGKSSAALPILRKLRSLPWNRSYHPNIPSLIEEMIETAETPLELPPPSANG